MIEIFRSLFAPPRHMILLVIAAWIGLTLSEKRVQRYGISREDLNNLTFYSLIAFILGGRILFVFENMPAFMKSPLGIFSINPDLFDLFGGVFAGAVAGLIYIQRRNLAFWSTLDTLTPFLATLMVGLGLSDLAAGTAFGIQTDLPWSIHLWNASRHPTQIYETIAALLTLGLLWFKKQDIRPGILFILFVAITSVWQLFIHAFRADSILIAGGFKQEQVMAWIVLAISFVMLEIRLARSTSPRSAR
jgi:phosphatidylglycerol:prolipoprotein diacylglycerol transferase